MTFVKTAKEPALFSGKAYFFIFSGNDILVKAPSKNKLSIPCLDEKGVAESD